MSAPANCARRWPGWTRGRTAAVMAAAAALAGCCHVPFPPGQARAEKRADAGRKILREEQSFRVSAAGVDRDVYWLAKNPRRAKRGPAVLVLHELNGLTRECVLLAERLQEEGFTVYLPLLFGRADHCDIVGGSLQAFFSPEWRPRRDGSKPITDWLREVCRRIGDDHAGRVGVVGMCLTGAMPIALLGDAPVAAAVVSQPTLPLPAFTRDAKYSLGIAHRELVRAHLRSHRRGIDILGLRYRHDGVAAREKFETLERWFGGHFMDREISHFEYDWGGEPLAPRSHAVLTIGYRDDPQHPAHRRYQEMVAFLKKRLR